MSAYRQDPRSGDWIIIAPQRHERPFDPGADLHDREREVGRTAAYDPDCPFCPGNEAELTEIIADLPSPLAPGWQARAVPNTYPILGAVPGMAGGGGPSLFSARPGSGRHEVIIETPRHDGDLLRMEKTALAALLGFCQGRFAALAREPGITAVTLFRNRGRAAGASLRHPHAQIIASSMTPPLLARTLAWGREEGEHRGHCPTCAMTAAELEKGRRLVTSTHGFVVIVPWAARRPFEQWIIPRRHQPCFSDMNDEEIADLALALRRALMALEGALGPVSYNYVVESALPPQQTETAGELLGRHWILRLAPALLRGGGFEMGTGFAVNPALPETDAAALRQTLERAGKKEGGDPGRGGEGKRGERS